MSPRDPYAVWRRQPSKAAVPNDFASKVMRAIAQQLAARKPARSRVAAYQSALALTAGAILVLLCHAGSIGLCLYAMTGVAR